MKNNGTQKAVQRQPMGILLCEQTFRDVWRRNKSVRAEIGQILHTHTHAAKLVVEIGRASSLAATLRSLAGIPTTPFLGLGVACTLPLH